MPVAVRPYAGGFPAVEAQLRQLPLEKLHSLAVIVLLQFLLGLRPIGHIARNALPRQQHKPHRQVALARFFQPVKALEHQNGLLRFLAELRRVVAGKIAQLLEIALERLYVAALIAKLQPILFLIALRGNRARARQSIERFGVGDAGHLQAIDQLKKAHGILGSRVVRLRDYLLQIPQTNQVFLQLAHVFAGVARLKRDLDRLALLRIFNILFFGNGIVLFHRGKRFHVGLAVYDQPVCLLEILNRRFREFAKEARAFAGKIAQLLQALLHRHDLFVFLAIRNRSRRKRRTGRQLADDQQDRESLDHRFFHISPWACRPQTKTSIPILLYAFLRVLPRPKPCRFCVFSAPKQKSRRRSCLPRLDFYV